MKNWLKILCAMAVAGTLALTAAAADAAVDTEAAELTLPDLVHAEEIQITSSLASDGTDLVPLYDLSADTAVTFENAADGVSISLTSSEAFRLHSIVIDKIDAVYEAKLYASDDSSEWVELRNDVKIKDDFVVYQVKNLGSDYKFYRLTLDTAEGGLTLHTLAMFEEVMDVWPFSLRQMFRPAVNAPAR
ncbi:MAG: hypothetical protein IJX14_06205 [Clostridia bacterium]|nr:hypothetical protein [Clostridia bacterium]